MKDKLIMLGLVVLLSACGTTTTLTRADYKIKSNLRKNNTSCESISRVYSGVAYDFCRLHSTPDPSLYNPFLPLFLVDAVFSAITDTVVLPYTIVQQSTEGNINL